MCSVIKKCQQDSVDLIFMSDVIHCFAFKIKISVLSIEFDKILRRKIKSDKYGKKTIKIIHELNYGKDQNFHYTIIYSSISNMINLTLSKK